ncbi:hypothetical protein CY652_03725 [Burkholderia sp. WAC0059]|uniref:lactonase family protein n=1 Tax=Burkholderia sp. WAC0059 TaxID=2066022 RepID=UPI000C7F5F38|nr:beta-propeller fold lactonase family protein [Burkholderia sp. WAC0059]PLZ03513.1 hypothetical protein CY652_03725 [Burkholderia sp. WAC0059]
MQTPATQDYLVIVSNAADGDLSTFRLDAANARLAPLGRQPAGEAVMPLARPGALGAADTRVLYAATRGAQPSLIEFSLDALNGRLERRHAVSIDASFAYLATDGAGRLLFGASYGENLLGVYSVERLRAGDGTPLQVIPEIPHAHAVIVSPDDRYAYVSSLGSDKVLACAIDAAHHDAPLRVIGTLALPAGFGPRHLRLSPCGGWLYVLSEFRSVVAAFRRDSASGALEPARISERASVLAELVDGYARPHFSAPVQPDPKTLATLIWAADIHVRPDGRFVYTSERTSSRLLVWRVDDDGSLRYAGFASTETQPRGFRITPDGRFLVACGERSTQVALYAVDGPSGALERLGHGEGGHGANWVEIVPLSARPAAS